MALHLHAFFPAVAAASGKTLPIVLLSGVVLLTICLVVLMWTRWGQARPLSKCAGLSLFAHLLLLCYAYSTCILSAPGSRDSFGTIQVRLADATADENASPDVGEQQPWEKVSVAGEFLPADFEPDRIDEAATPKVAEVAQSNPLRAPPLLEKPAEDNPPTPSPTPAAAEPLPEIAASETPPLQQPAEMVAANAPNPSTPADEPNVLDSALPPIAPQEVPVATAAAPPRRIGDGEALPTPLKSRVAADRLKIAQKYGGSPQTEAAVAAALDWLAANQSADGRWDADAHGAGRENKALGHDRGGAGKEADTGITGLALLAFLASGETHLDGPHREAVQHGLEFLLASQAEDGCLAGSSEFFAAMYCHGIATLALSEAYALSGDARLKNGLERAIRFTLNSQHISGGWRYKPHDPGDISQFGWQLMAIKSAELGGIEIPLECRTRMQRFLRSASSGRRLGLVSYRPGDRISRTMTAEGLVCRYFLDAENAVETIEEATAYVQEELPGGGQVNLYYWYYGTLAMFQRQGPDWQRWNEALQRQLLTLQRLDGERAGSWDPDPVWGGYGGRVYSTSMATLCLEVYYRYLPLYSSDFVAERPSTLR